MRERVQHNGWDEADEPSSACEDVHRPLFGRWTTALIVALLLGPWAVYYVSSEEPYPAGILPGGASVVNIDNGEVTFEIRTYVGYDAAGVPTYLDLTELLDPVPSSHSRALLESRFGQDDASTRRILVDLWIRMSDVRVPRHVPSEADQATARAWLNDKLTAAGLVPDRFEVWYERIVVDHATGDEISREQTDKVVILD